MLLNCMLWHWCANGWGAKTTWWDKGKIMFRLHKLNWKMSRRRVKNPVLARLHMLTCRLKQWSPAWPPSHEAVDASDLPVHLPSWKSSHKHVVWTWFGTYCMNAGIINKTFELVWINIKCQHFIQVTGLPERSVTWVWPHLLKGSEKQEKVWLKSCWYIPVQNVEVRNFCSPFPQSWGVHVKLV